MLCFVFPLLFIFVACFVYLILLCLLFVCLLLFVAVKCVLLVCLTFFVAVVCSCVGLCFFVISFALQLGMSLLSFACVACGFGLTCILLCLC